MVVMMQPRATRCIERERARARQGERERDQVDVLLH